MLEWEYMRVDLGQTSNKLTEVDVLNAMGREGWELVLVTPHNHAFFKRRKQASRSAAGDGGSGRSKERPGTAT